MKDNQTPSNAQPSDEKCKHGRRRDTGCGACEREAKEARERAFIESPKCQEVFARLTRALIFAEKGSLETSDVASALECSTRTATRYMKAYGGQIYGRYKAAQSAGFGHGSWAASIEITARALVDMLRLLMLANESAATSEYSARVPSKGTAESEQAMSDIAKDGQRRLAKAVYAYGIDFDGREIDQGMLHAGTLVRRVRLDDLNSRVIVYFEASTDDGKTWHRNKTHACLLYEPVASESAPTSVLEGAPYWTIIIPHVPPKYATEWHPTDTTGPFATLTRGAFKNRDEAIEWAREHLKGTPYELRLIDG